METLTCPKCGTSNPSSAINCANCGINLQFALQNPAEVERSNQQETRRAQGLPEVEAPKPETELTTLEATASYAVRLLKDGWSAPFVETALVQNGVKPASASLVVRNLQELKADALRRAGKKNMVYGFLLFIGGILFTLASFAFSSMCGIVLVARGAIFVGALLFLLGLV